MITRREQLKLLGVTGASFALGVGLGYWAGSRPEGDQSRIPAETVNPFTIGATTFGFESAWTTAEQDLLRGIVEKIYWPGAEIYGTEPTDSSGETGVFTLIQQAELPTGEYGSSETVLGTNRHDMTLPAGLPSEQLRYLAVHEFGHVAWGATSIGQWDRPPYRPFNEGFADALAGRFGYTGDDFSIMKKLYGIGRFDPSLANKPHVAFYGDSLRGLKSVRNILAATACTQFLNEDHHFFSQFRQNYLSLIQSGDPYEIVTIDAIRSLAQNSFSGDWNAIEQKHHIVGEATHGDQVIIAPVASANLGEEILAAFVFNRDSRGFVETPISGITASTEFYVDGIPRPTRPIQTNDLGIVTLLRSSDLEQDKGASVTVRVNTEKGSDEVSFIA